MNGFVARPGLAIENHLLNQTNLIEHLYYAIFLDHPIIRVMIN